MKEQMVIDIVLRIECREWQPRECGRKTATANGFPKHPAPLDVIITIEITAADRRGGELKPQKIRPIAIRPTTNWTMRIADSDSSEESLAKGFIYRPTAFVKNDSQLLDEFNQVLWVDRFGHVSVETRADRLLTVIKH